MPDSRKTGRRHLTSLLLAIMLVAAVALAGSNQGSVYPIAGVHIPVFVLCALIALGLNWIMFLPSYLARTEHYFDLTGSLTFVTVMLTALMLSPSQDLRVVTLTLLVCIWATRLGGFLFLRVRTDGGDGRFDAIKGDFLRFLLAWTLQGVWVLLSSAAALAAITSTNRVEMGPVAVAGIVLWASGFIVEVAADAQKRAFRADSHPAHHPRQRSSHAGSTRGKTLGRRCGLPDLQGQNTAAGSPPAPLNLQLLSKRTADSADIRTPTVIFLQNQMAHYS